MLAFGQVEQDPHPSTVPGIMGVVGVLEQLEQEALGILDRGLGDEALGAHDRVGKGVDLEGFLDQSGREQAHDPRGPLARTGSDHIGAVRHARGLTRSCGSCPTG